MRYILLVFFIICNLFTNAQQFEPITIAVQSLTILYKEPKSDPILAIGNVDRGQAGIYAFSYVKDVQNKGFFHIYYNNKVYWLPDNTQQPYVYDYNKFQKFSSLGHAGDAERFAFTKKYVDQLNAEEDLQRRADSLREFISIAKAVDAGLKNGLLVQTFIFGYPNEYSLSVDVSVSIRNFSKKTIKYVYFTVAAKDAVGGRISSFGKQTFQLKGVGPIKENEDGDYTFENVIYSKIVDDTYLTQIVVEYMDGTKKTYTNIKTISLDTYL